METVTKLETQHFQIKTQLAKLLATENISMRQDPGVKTAYFNIKDRLLVLPVWQNISEDLTDMLIIHEVGHALDTPVEEWVGAIQKIILSAHVQKNVFNEAAVKDFLNVVEDVRVDKRQKRRYPGSRKNYVYGHRELFERNFFGIKNKDVNSLHFIDRVNVYFKGGFAMNIKFSPEEMKFIKRMELLETFAEVAQLTEEIYIWAKKEAQERIITVRSLSYEDGDEEGAGDDGGEGDEEGAGDDGGEGDKDGDEGATVWSFDNGAEGNKNSSDEENGTDDDIIPSCLTEQNARKSLQSIVLDGDTKYVYLNIPKFIHEHIVTDWSKVLPSMEQNIEQSFKDCGTFIGPFIAELADFKKKEQEKISFMVKEFEMRKSADVYSRISIAKTGVINTNKLHSYKYNDDIFRKLSIVPTGKNHGFVMLLDWSGSMRLSMKSTLKQLFGLVMFCKKVQIPFEVYFFRSGTNRGNYYSQDPMVKEKVIETEGSLMFGDFKIQNIISSRMNVSTLNRAMLALWTSYTTNCGGEYMGNTPLNQSVLAFDKVVNDFRKRYKCQIVNTIVLTDGESDPVKGYVGKEDYHTGTYDHSKKKHFVLTDDITKKVYHFDYELRNMGNEATSIFLNILKERTNTNLIGFYLLQGSYRHLQESFRGINGERNEYFLRPETQKKWKDDGYLEISFAGYDQYYIIDVSMMTKKLEENELCINPKMTKNRMMKEFIKFSEKKTINRALLSGFITQVSSQIKETG
jgi:hypothetical protein